MNIYIFFFVYFVLFSVLVFLVLVLRKAVNAHGLCNSTVRQLLQRKHTLGREA